MQALKPYCTNTQPKRVARTALPALTELRSLQIKVSQSASCHFCDRIICAVCP